MLTGEELVARLAVAAALAAFVGYEREFFQHPAGVRTHALVGVGAALFTIAGAYGFSDVDAATADPARIGAQVATGIGFVGGGAILRTGGSVRGLTTAATLWLAAAVGVTSGAGRYDAAAWGCALVLVLLVGLRFVKRWLPSSRGVVLKVEYMRGQGTIGPLIREVDQWAAVRRLNIEDDDHDCTRPEGLRTVVMELSLVDGAAMDRSLDRLRARPEICSIECVRAAAFRLA